MNAAKIVVHEVNRNSGNMIVDFLREPVREAGETAHSHSHGKILALYITGAYMLRIRIPADDLHIGTDAFSWGIPRPTTRDAPVQIQTDPLPASS